MHTKPKKTLLPSLQVSPVARALSITPRVPSSPGDSIVNFVEEAGRIAGGDRSDEDHPSIFQKARDKKKKMLDLIRPPVAVCGPNMSNFHSPFPSTATPPWRPGIPVYV